MASEQGFSNQKKKGKAQFKTIHSSGSDSYSEQVIPKYLSDLVVPPVSSFISTITDIFGSNGQVEFWEIAFLDPHYAIKGDVYRIKGSADDLFNFEFEIVSVVDANTIRVLPISDVKPTSLEYGTIKRWVTANSDDDGNPKVSLVPASTKFLLDGVITDVSKDTTNPANSLPLPVEDAQVYGLLTDFSNIIGNVDNVPGSAGAGVPSLVFDPALGEFKYALVDSSGNLKVSAASLPLPSGASTEAKQDTGNSSLSSIDGKFTTLNAKDFATSAKQDTGNSSLSSIDGKFTTLNAKDFATSAKQDTGNSSLSSIDGKLQSNGFLDAGNSSVTPLGSGGVFTGAAFEVTKYAAINVNVISDVASATNGVKVEFSTDGTNWDHSHQTTYSAATGVGYIFNAEFKFARVVYTNGATAQAYFRLQTIFKTGYVAPSLYTLDQTVTGSMFAQLQKSTIIGKTTGGGGGFVDVKVNPSGALTVEAAVTGSVSVTNFPATQAVTGTFFQATQPVSGSVSVSNFPSTQNVAEQTQSGTITQIQKAVGLTAVRATVSGSAPSAARKKLLIKPSKNNTGAVYFGSSAVTTASGLEIIGPDRLEFLLDASDYYLISDTAAQVVEIIEVI